jgi:hypothetical protein
MSGPKVGSQEQFGIAVAIHIHETWRESMNSGGKQVDIGEGDCRHIRKGSIPIVAEQTVAGRFAHPPSDKEIEIGDSLPPESA